MKISEVFPPDGHIQSLYCDKCHKSMGLVYRTFNENVSGIDIQIIGLPYLYCEKCQVDYLPDDSRFAIIYLHKQATQNGILTIKSTRNKSNTQYNFTSVPFIYDSDDYRYLPGLYREHDIGFLTPVFFNKTVLLKYDAMPNYSVQFASTTYGTIYGPEFYISFGINKNGKVLMWLGDIAKLPETEQYHLRSENIPSDHSIGSEFYDGQIECIFTGPRLEDDLFKLRSEFLENSFKKFGRKIAHLDAEVLELAGSLNPPVVDTPKERRNIADILNKIYVESIDNNALGEILKASGIKEEGTGSIKRLQALLQSIAPNENIPDFMSPFYILYDFRVAASHLKSKVPMKEITKRLSLEETAPLSEIYQTLCCRLKSALEKMTSITSI